MNKTPSLPYLITIPKSVSATTYSVDYKADRLRHESCLCIIKCLQRNRIDENIKSDYTWWKISKWISWMSLLMTKRAMNELWIIRNKRSCKLAVYACYTLLVTKTDPSRPFQCFAQPFNITLSYSFANATERNAHESAPHRRFLVICMFWVFDC